MVFDYSHKKTPPLELSGRGAFLVIWGFVLPTDVRLVVEHLSSYVSIVSRVA